MFLCNIALYSIGPCFYHQSHPQLGIVLFWLHSFILSGVISPLISSSILGTYWPGEFLFQYPIILPSHTVHGIIKARILKCLPFPSPVDHIMSNLSSMPSHLGWPYRAWVSFIELDKAVVLVWLDWLVFCDYGFSVSALLQHLPSYLGFSYLGRGVSLHGCSSKVQPLLLTLDEG